MPYGTLHCITRIHSQQMISNRGNLDAALESFPLAVAYLRPPPSREAQLSGDRYANANPHFPTHHYASLSQPLGRAV